MPETQRTSTDESGQNCALQNEGVFSTLPSQALQAFDQVRLDASYPEGAVLFMEGDSPRGVYILCKGRVKLTMTSSDGKTVILRITKPGEILGLHAVVSDKPYQATAETVEPCQVSFVQREDFLRFLRTQPGAFLPVVQQLSRYYEFACEQIRSLGLSHSARGKLSTLLLDWAESGQSAADGIRVRLILTHEEIGQIIGLSRETVTRTLGDLKQRRVVTQRGATLVIQNRPALEGFARA